MCPELLSPVNGTVQYSGVGVESVAEYSCDCGFILLGASRRVCQPSNTWTGEEPTCLKSETHSSACLVPRLSPLCGLI